MKAAAACAWLICAAGAASAAQAGGIDEAVAEYAQSLDEAPAGSSSCAAAYRGLGRGGELKLGVFFGFADAGPWIIDRSLRRALIAALTRPCRTPEHACGFRPQPRVDDDAPTLLTKTLAWDGRPVRVLLEVADSSVSGDAAVVDGPLRSRQTEKTRRTADLFVQALKEDDVVVYAGHSRYGTGPSFGPMPFFSLDSARVYWSRPMLARMSSALRGAARGPAALAMLSCDSRHLYAGNLGRMDAAATLIDSSDLTSHLDNELAALGLIDSVLARRCPADFQRSLNQDGSISAFSLEGFFGAPPAAAERFGGVLRDLFALALLPWLAALAGRPLGEPPLPAPSAARDAAALAASLLPAPWIARTLSGDTVRTLPCVLGIAGAILCAQALARRALTPEAAARLARRVAGPLLAAAALMWVLHAQADATALGAAAASRRALALAGFFALFFPFFVFAENFLLAPFLRRGAAGLLAATAASTAFYEALFFAMNRGGPRLLVAGPFALAFAAGAAPLGFALCRGARDASAAAALRALALAWLFAAGLQGALYY